ncbi:hypothetical protein JJJ17_05060 [Paracoccus caeni]|uniref:Uncharacterized protein n=1 Tax=Paracoccus caeni TaxID=657651 RepID=A0A934SCB6_9RHOB|nr:hypothetical protein [Paracoccus caeni]MBK4215292.1 hypothetical protein [Paracoccus caeni]
MAANDEDIQQMTEADRTSETRFGPRPVPEGHRKAADYPYHDRVSSRVIPSGRVSPDGRSAYPTPSLTSKILVFGGVALGVAGATAGAVLAARKIAGLIGGDQDNARGSRRASVAPRFAELDEDEREAMRSRVRAQSRHDSREAARLRAEASRKRDRPRRNVAREMTDTANDLSSGLDGLGKALFSAFTGFRSVAGQATGIVSEFAAAADQLRNILGNGEPQRHARDDTRAEEVEADQDSFRQQERERQRTHRL